MNTRGQAVDIKGAIVAFNQGAVAMEQGDEPSALAAWRKALELDPCLIPAALNLITYHQQRDDFATEAMLWDKVLAYDPFDTDNLILQAAAYRHIGEAEKAIDNYLRAISIYPYFKFWYHELARIYDEINEPEEAALWRGRGDSLGADEAEICYEDGLHHCSDERWPSARSCFEAVLDEFPANLDARLRLADVLVEAGTTEEIISQYHNAMELTDAAKGLVHYRLGEFHAKAGEYKLAEREFELALASVPQYLKAERALLKVHQSLDRAVGGGPTARPSAAAEQFRQQHPSTATPQAGILGGNERLLKPEEIGLEPVGLERPHQAGLRIEPPDRRQPWQQQLRKVLDQALSVASPGGQSPRVAVLVEPDPELAEPTTFALADLRAMSRGLRTEQNQSDILTIRSNFRPVGAQAPNVMSAWFNRETAAHLDPSRWSRVRPGIALDSALSALVSEGAPHGFNCLLVVSFGRCLPLERSVTSLVDATRLHCVCFLHPRYHYLDFRATVGPAVSNFIDIAF